MKTLEINEKLLKSISDFFQDEAKTKTEMLKYVKIINSKTRNK